MRPQRASAPRPRRAARRHRGRRGVPRSPRGCPPARTRSRRWLAQRIHAREHGVHDRVRPVQASSTTVPETRASCAGSDVARRHDASLRRSRGRGERRRHEGQREPDGHGDQCAPGSRGPADHARSCLARRHETGTSHRARRMGMHRARAPQGPQPATSPRAACRAPATWRTGWRAPACARRSCWRSPPLRSSPSPAAPAQLRSRQSEPGIREALAGPVGQRKLQRADADGGHRCGEPRLPQGKWQREQIKPRRAETHLACHQRAQQRTRAVVRDRPGLGDVAPRVVAAADERAESDVRERERRDDDRRGRDAHGHGAGGAPWRACTT